MFNLKFKQIQCAISDGRLDQAYRLIVADETVERHRKGQKLIAKLARALVNRGREHLSADRLSNALNDCNKADKLGGSQTEIAELRRAVCKTMEQKQFAHQQRNQRLQVAQKEIDNGWLSVGIDILGDVEHAQASILKDQADAERKKVDSVAAKVEEALKNGNLRNAADLYIQAGTASRNNAKFTELGRKIISLAVKQITENLNIGRVDLAESGIKQVAGIDRSNAEIGQFTQVISQCKTAAEHLHSGRCRQAMGILKKLKLVLPDAEWVSAACEKAQKAAEAMDSLYAGPLGLVDVSTESDTTNIGSPNVSGSEKKSTVNEVLQIGGKDAVPDRFVLQVDGVGGFLTFRRDKVTVGPISSSARPDLALMAGAHIPTVSIERHDEDYFLRSDENIHVGERRVTEKLLNDGDKIALSTKCRMKFNRPNAASSTATLMLSSARLHRPDINHVILMDREILVGPGEGNHIRAAGQSLAFYLRDGKMYCRTDDAVMIDGKKVGADAALVMEKPIQIGQLNIVLARA